MKTTYAIVARSKSVRTLMSFPEFNQDSVIGNVDRTGRLPVTIYNLYMETTENHSEAKRFWKKLPKLKEVKYFIKTITEE
jgi:hypothetical protein